ncbi:MAG TPA: glycosyltransferase family 4 protein [Chloroflexi bacterium]|nr:glycosyltransferase family 4 protein [Chloroflexota bacterium]
MKRVLIIAYYFPPIGGSGVQRPTKFVKYLPEFGWQPYVISTDRPYGDGAEGYDETLLADIPASVRVWRVPTPQPRPVYRLAQWLGWRSAAVEAYRRGVTPPPVAVAPTKQRPPNLVARLRHAMLAPLYLIHNPPVDPALYWALRIVPLARRIIEQEQIDVVFTTVPPWSALITGAQLRHLTGRPWVADFRDPWTDNAFVYFPTTPRRWLDKHLERSLLRQTDAVIAETPPNLAALVQKTRPNQRLFATIPNGWDREDFPDLASVRAGLPPSASADGRIVLLHPGSAYQGEPLPLLWGVERLAATGEVDLDRLRFHFVGAVHPMDRQTIERSPQGFRFHFDTQRISHDQALRLMREAHVLLLLLRRKGPRVASGKLFEYLVAGRPVLASGAVNGVAGQIVRRCGVGCVVEPDDIDGMAQMLRSVITDYAHLAAKVYQPDWNEIERYERRLLTSRLAATFDQLLTRP